MKKNKDENKQFILKPCKDIQKAVCGIGMLFPLCIFAIGIIMSIVNSNIHDFIIGLVISLSAVALCLCVYASIRLFFYRAKIIVKKNEIIKYQRRKVVFQINTCDIIELCHRPASAWYAVLLRPFGVFFGDPLCDILSIRYKKSEVESVRIIDSFYKLNTLTEAEKNQGLKEYIECLTEKEVQKICKFINLKARIVEVQ